MTVKVGLLGDPVDHYDGHVGIVIEANNGFFFDNNILVTQVTDDIRGHIATGHERICKISTGSSVLYIDGLQAALDGSEVDCDGKVRAQAQVVYADW